MKQCSQCSKCSQVFQSSYRGTASSICPVRIFGWRRVLALWRASRVGELLLKHPFPLPSVGHLLVLCFVGFLRLGVGVPRSLLLLFSLLVYIVSLHHALHRCFLLLLLSIGCAASHARLSLSLSGAGCCAVAMPISSNVEAGVSLSPFSGGGWVASGLHHTPGWSGP